VDDVARVLDGSSGIRRLTQSTIRQVDSPAHHKWTWSYRPYKDSLYQRKEDRIEAYTYSATQQVRLGQTYPKSHIVENLPQPVLTATAPTCRGIGPHLFVPEETNPTFWELLQSLGGEWMWEHIKDKESDMSWARNAMINGTLIAVHDGSYDRERERVGVDTTLCTASRQTLRGSFYKISPMAGSFRGEFLGLAVIHTLTLAVARFFHLDCVYEKICCDNIVALNQSSRVRQRVQVGIKHLDLHRTIRNLRCSTKMAFKYVHVRAHQDGIKP
jgi:hypothetical protein